MAEETLYFFLGLPSSDSTVADSESFHRRDRRGSGFTSSWHLTTHPLCCDSQEGLSQEGKRGQSTFMVLHGSGVLR